MGIFRRSFWERIEAVALRKSDILIGHGPVGNTLDGVVPFGRQGLLRDRGAFLKRDYWTMVEFCSNRLWEIYDLEFIVEYLHNRTGLLGLPEINAGKLSRWNWQRANGAIERHESQPQPAAIRFGTRTALSANSYRTPRIKSA